MKVELTDIVFAIDSILVAVAMSPKLWVILTGGILGIVMMRLVIGQLLALVERYPALVDGAFVIIALGRHQAADRVRCTPKATSHFEIPKWLSLGADRRDLRRSSLVYALLKEKKEGKGAPH